MQAHDEAMEQQYWSAVVKRDRTFDGRFFYGVVTTGVYCRPSCGAAHSLARKRTILRLACGGGSATGCAPVCAAVPRRNAGERNASSPRLHRGTCRGKVDARDSRTGSRNEPLSFPEDLQSRGRDVAARIPGRIPHGPPEEEPARIARRGRRRVRGGLRIVEPGLRTGRRPNWG